jgi:wobble nucleotide-excising tRNase
MGGLSSINYVYGPNGSGKTTISRLIDSPNDGKFASCSINWHRGTNLETLVYNRDFVDANFNQSSTLKGIFTLGQKSIETQNKIDQANNDVTVLTHEIESLTFNLQGADGISGKRGELASVESAFKDECWKLVTRHKAKLQGAISGYLGSKEKFKQKVILECAKNSPQPPSQADLEARAGIVFGNTLSSEAPLANLNDADFLRWESDPILKKHVIGKADVDIASMIHKLGNSDWVKQGITFFEISEGNCPFCQQKAPERLATSLAEYFDEAFTKDTAEIAAMLDGYKLEGEKLQQTLQAAIISTSRFLDIESLKSEKFIFDTRFQGNLQKIENKVKEPSQAVTLEPLKEILISVKHLISDANQKIQTHNTMVANISSERALLTTLVWAFLAKVEIATAFKNYQNEKRNKEAAITSFETQISNAEIDKSAREREIQMLERSTTSIQPTVDAINSILRSFGFQNFSIKTASNNNYRICRPDGTEAKDTLSEGEKSFLTFLYFYHLLKGSNFESGMTRNRVVVFDDPVSSLDSDVLFIVSSLIRQIINDIHDKRGYIKQVFVLTHNVYFHKEITFISSKPGCSFRDETFWTIRKLGGFSKIKKHTSNPIKTSYDLLWTDVRERNLASQTIQNTLRRILEYYFRILGGMKFDDIINLFEGEEKLICSSLFSWIHDGSHSVPDDVFIALDENTVEKQLEVFKKIFAKTKHLNHYNMMMGDPYTIESVAVHP